MEAQSEEHLENKKEGSHLVDQVVEETLEESREV